MWGHLLSSCSRGQAVIFGPEGSCAAGEQRNAARDRGLPVCISNFTETLFREYVTLYCIPALFIEMYSMVHVTHPPKG